MSGHSAIRSVASIRKKKRRSPARLSKMRSVGGMFVNVVGIGDVFWSVLEPGHCFDDRNSVSPVGEIENSIWTEASLGGNVFRIFFRRVFALRSVTCDCFLDGMYVVKNLVVFQV